MNPLLGEDGGRCPFRNQQPKKGDVIRTIRELSEGGVPPEKKGKKGVWKKYKKNLGKKTEGGKDQTGVFFGKRVEERRRKRKADGKRCGEDLPF